jgi:pyrroloquinoline quinone biosynthesis protein E
MLITPNGDALPCHAAQVIPGLSFENVKNRGLREIWDHSEAFQKFRGEGWMKEPCKTCDRREQDFGGCRCQALLLAGNASATDPVCSLSPQRNKVDAILANLNAAPASAGTGPASIAGGAGLAAPAAEPLTKPAWLYRPNPS